MTTKNPIRRDLERQVFNTYLSPNPSKDNVEWLDSEGYKTFLKHWEKLLKYYRNGETPFISVDVLLVYHWYMGLFDEMSVESVGEQIAYDKAMQAKKHLQYDFDEIIRHALYAMNNLDDVVCW